MIAAPGSAVWFAHHESRLAWRDWLAMMTAGRRERLPRVVIAIAVFFIFMHFVAYWTVGRYASALPDKPPPIPPNRARTKPSDRLIEIDRAPLV